MHPRTDQANNSQAVYNNTTTIHNSTLTNNMHVDSKWWCAIQSCGFRQSYLKCLDGAQHHEKEEEGYLDIQPEGPGFTANIAPIPGHTLWRSFLHQTLLVELEHMQCRFSRSHRVNTLHIRNCNLDWWLTQLNGTKEFCDESIDIHQLTALWPWQSH